MNNYLIFSFTNAVFIDIFSRYATNSEMADFVAEDGSVSMKFKMINGIIEPPKTCEEALSLICILLESNPQSAAGKVLAAHKDEIFREILFRLPRVLDSFSDIHIIVNSVTSENDTDDLTESRREVTITRTFSTHTESSNI